MKKIIDTLKTFGVVWPFVLLFVVFIVIGLSPSPRQENANPPRGAPVTDMVGRTARISVPAEKVFILTPILWHYLTVSQTDKPIVMLPPYMTNEFAVSVLGNIYPELKEKALAFTDFSGPSPISVEELLESDPDAALVWNYMSGGPELVNLRSLLQISADGGDKTKLFNMLGELTGGRERVEWIWRRFQTEYDQVVADIRPCVQQKRVAVVGTSGFALWGPPSQRYFTDNLEKVCGVNVASNFPAQGGGLNIENILILDPDVIWLNPYVLEQTDMNVRTLYDDPRLSGLKAVKNRTIYHMPLGASRLEGPVEVPLSMLWQRIVMFPTVGTKLNMRDKIRRTYLEVYGYEMSDQEIDNWLRMEENSVSSEYARLFGKGDDVD